MTQRTITPFAQRLLDALRQQSGVWRTRRELAADVGKDHLNPYNLTVLAALQQQGLIEVSQRENSTPIGFEWMYRATGADH